MPQNTIRIGRDRLGNSASDALIGSYIGAARFPDTLTSAIYWLPFRTPCDMDVSRPAVVSFGLQLESDSPVNPTRVVTLLGWTSFEPNGPPAQHLVGNIKNIEIPPNLGAGTCLFIDYLALNQDYSIAGGTLTPNTVLGFRLFGTRNSGADTYVGTVNITDSMFFRYYRRCQSVCCP